MANTSLRTTLKKQRKAREQEKRRHYEDLAAWILQRGPVGDKLAKDVNLVPGRGV